jgi:hypothetical protein
MNQKKSCYAGHEVSADDVDVVETLDCLKDDTADHDVLKGVSQSRVVHKKL